MTDLINNLLAKVAALTQTVNLLISGSKSIPELPEQTTLVTSSLLHASNNGVSEKISVQQIINASITNTNDQLINVGAISLTGNDLTIDSISGKINNIFQSISTPTTVNIPFCATGLQRIDLIIYTNTNNIVRIAGNETSASIVVTPTLPIETLLVTQILVSDSTIGDPTTPVLGSTYLKKIYESIQTHTETGTGINVVINLNTDGRSNIKLEGPITSVSGFSFANLLANPTTAEFPFLGKRFTLWNNTGSSVILNHEDNANDMFFSFKNGQNLILPNKENIEFIYNTGVLQEASFSVPNKRTQIIQFAWIGGNYSSTTNWWKLNAFTQKYGTSFINGGSVINVNNAFADDNNNFCFRESLMFNGKIKAITVEGDNNGVSWNCDFAIRNHELLSPYNAGFSTAAINNQIVARKQFTVGAGGFQTRTFFEPITDFGDLILPKNSILKPYFKTQGVANSNWQNVVLTILIEEL